MPSGYPVIPSSINRIPGALYRHMTRSNTITFIVLLFLLICSNPAVSDNLEDIYNRQAVQAPQDSGYQDIEEGDEVDQEIEKYFKEISSTTRVDLDRRRLSELFGNHRRNPRIAPEVDPDQIQFSNINSQDTGESSGLTNHKVVAGDTIFSIGQTYRVTPQQILQHNPDLDKRPLYIGESILVVTSQTPAVSPVAQAVYHTVRPGDSLGAIARRYRINVRNLCQMNRLSERSVIRPGLTLRVSSAVLPPRGYRFRPVFQWPVAGVITSGFGRRYNPFLGGFSQYHKGIDIGAGIGTRFNAARDGVVILAGRMGGYGNCLFIRHASGYVSVYGHARALLVKKGDIVKRGQAVGLVGRTGTATGPHLHFEVRRLMEPINPLAALNLQELVPEREVASAAFRLNRND